MLSKADKAYLQDTFATKEEMSELRAELRNDFFNKFDEVMGELKAIREEMAAMLYRQIDHEERITRIEEKIAF